MTFPDALLWAEKSPARPYQPVYLFCIIYPKGGKRVAVDWIPSLIIVADDEPALVYTSEGAVVAWIEYQDKEDTGEYYYGV